MNLSSFMAVFVSDVPDNFIRPRYLLLNVNRIIEDYPVS